MTNPERRQELLDLLLRYLRQPSTWQGVTLALGSLATYLGVPAEQVTSVAILAFAAILVFRDERKPTEVVKDAIAKALEDKVDKS